MKREVIAYAITHAPRGQKGGPYWATVGGRTPDLRGAVRYPATARGLRGASREADLCHARVIRIVRARPSEASAENVLRELVAHLDKWSDDSLPVSRLMNACIRIEVAARRVLASAGPDPMPVVRAALRETEAEEAFDRVAVKGRSMNAAADAIGVARANRIEAVDAYRKAGGK